MFLVCGEALMDLFVTGETPTGAQLDARIGGSPLNVAVGLARLGHAVRFFGGIGTGVLGDRLMRALVDEGVATTDVVRSPAPTTLGLVGLTRSGVADYAFYGEGGADRQVLPAQLGALASAQAYHFGSYAMVVEPVGSTLRQLAAQVSARALVAYDINVRLNVEPRVERWREVLQALLPHVHLLKLSREDWNHLFADDDLGPRVAQWLQQGPRVVILTDGEAGCRLFTRGGSLQVPAAACALVDTVGAGDTLQATVLSALADRQALHPQALATLGLADWQTLLQRAARAAAITCGRRGADLPRRAELDAAASA
jgi:fructokinase